MTRDELDRLLDHCPMGGGCPKGTCIVCEAEEQLRQPERTEHPSALCGAPAQAVTGNRPSNLVARLRSSASIGVSHPHFMPIAEACIEAANLIEQWEVLSLVAICKERDELKHDIERYIAISSEHATENERLRAALTILKNARWRGDQQHTMSEVNRIAAEALAGGADETDDCPRSTDGRHEFGCIKCGEPAESATAQEADHRHCFWPGERHGMDHKCAKCGRLDREHACPCWKLGGQ